MTTIAAPRRRRSRINRRSWPARIMLTVGVLFFLVWIVFPISFTIMTSFETPGAIGIKPYSWFPREFTLDNYIVLLTGNNTVEGFTDRTGSVRGLLPSLGNSLLVSTAMVVSNIIIGGSAAYAFSRYPFRGAKVMFGLLLVSRVIPSLAIIAPFFVALKTLGLINTPTALIISYNVFTLPLVVWLMKSYFDSVPIEVEEAARIDGAGRTRTLIQVVAPLARPGLIAASLLIFLEAWGEFFYSLVLTNQLTLPPFIAGMRSLQTFSLTTVSAATIIALIPPVVLSVVFQRYIVSGLAQGSTK